MPDNRRFKGSARLPIEQIIGAIMGEPADPNKAAVANPQYNFDPNFTGPQIPTFGTMSKGGFKMSKNDLAAQNALTQRMIPQVQEQQWRSKFAEDEFGRQTKAQVEDRMRQARNTELAEIDRFNNERALLGLRGDEERKTALTRQMGERRNTELAGVDEETKAQADALRKQGFINREQATPEDLDRIAANARLNSLLSKRLNADQLTALGRIPVGEIGQQMFSKQFEQGVNTYRPRLDTGGGVFVDAPSVETGTENVPIGTKGATMPMPFKRNVPGGPQFVPGAVTPDEAAELNAATRVSQAPPQLPTVEWQTLNTPDVGFKSTYQGPVSKMQEEPWLRRKLVDLFNRSGAWMSKTNNY